jgi:hypothetical protein
LLAAPWWADAYKKQALAQEAAGRYDDAIASLKLYLLTQPADARDAQDEIYKLKANKQAAAEDELKKQREAEAKAKESSPEAVAARRQIEFDEWLKKLDGRRYTYHPPNPEAATSVIDISGGSLTWGMIFPPGHPGGEGYHPDSLVNHIRICSRETTVYVADHTRVTAREVGLKVWVVSFVFIISEDGDSVIVRPLRSDGSTWSDDDDTYFWQR